MGDEAYLRDISGLHLFTRASGMSENMEGPKKKIYKYMFLVDANMVDVV